MTSHRVDGSAHHTPLSGDSGLNLIDDGVKFKPSYNYDSNRTFHWRIGSSYGHVQGVASWLPLPAPVIRNFFFDESKRVFFFFLTNQKEFYPLFPLSSRNSKQEPFSYFLSPPGSNEQIWSGQQKSKSTTIHLILIKIPKPCKNSPH